MASYRLRCSIPAHDMDVRGVAPLPNSASGGFASVSRDRTACLWVPAAGPGSEFREAARWKAHDAFVSCVCALPPSAAFPAGLVATGGHDGHVCVFAADAVGPAAVPLYRLEGHGSTVCCLAVAGDGGGDGGDGGGGGAAPAVAGALVSGSWDATARVWLRDKCVTTLQGHGASVWAVSVLHKQGAILTGSADKSIKMWKAGRCEVTYTGHEDCVRGLVVLGGGEEFLSCGNDSSVRRWALAGPCLSTLYAHTNYVYSICLLPNASGFVTGGEDRTVRVWRGEECVQTVRLPAQSVWSVCALPNGDIVAATSDGRVHVFTESEDRAAPASEQRALEEELAGSAIDPKTGDLGDIGSSELPGREHLDEPGTRDGQTRLIREEGRVEAYQWSAALGGDGGRWIKIGDVVGSSGATQQTSGRVMYEGKEYDYVFSVDLNEGGRPLKLPYNVSEDPWTAANAFLGRHDLSSLFLDQVANFIVENTRGATLGGGASAGQADPFTGGGRYIPGVGSAPHGTPGSQATAPNQRDPFTGGGAYLSGAKPAAVSSSAFFPQTKVVTFDQANASAIVAKISDLNKQVAETLRASDGDLQALQTLADCATRPETGETITTSQLEALELVLSWPDEFLFPALDILRLCLRLDVPNKHFLGAACGPAQLSRLLALTSAPKAGAAAPMLALRALCNACSRDPGRRLMRERRSRVVEGALELVGSDNRNVQVALATLLLNYAVLHNESSSSSASSPNAAADGDDDEATTQLLSAAVALLERRPDAEAAFRLLVCVATLLLRGGGGGGDAARRLSDALGVRAHAERCAGLPGAPAKLTECARSLLAFL
uniref:Phospholipase A-2-activating protein n=1 Tax=Petromyzon marinus TaxID=7757 RepID=A0AAJ7T623_PETMA|nr:phospholipase A-2-activating protein [Petromyzon marinus]